MHEYPGYSVRRICQELTREQMVLLQEKASNRIMDDRRFLAKLHDYELKGHGLDFSGAVAIEDMLDRGGVQGFGG